MIDRPLAWSPFEKFLAGLTLASLGFCAWAWLDAGFYQRVQSSRLDAILRRVVGATARSAKSSAQPMAAATRAEARDSGLVGRLQIPRLGVEAIVAEGTDSRTLRRAVGHLPMSSLPGEKGNVALVGHRDSFFNHLDRLRLKDRIRMTTPDGVFDYQVESKRVVRPEDWAVLSASDSPTLTLITCYPFRYVGSAPERFVVRARQVQDVR